MPSTYIMDNYRGAAKYSLNLVNSILLRICLIMKMIAKFTICLRKLPWKGEYGVDALSQTVTPDIVNVFEQARPAVKTAAA
jgi:hypothetical protein